MAGFDQNMSADNALINNTSAGLQMGVPNPYSTPVTGAQAPPSDPTVQAFHESRARTQGLMAQITAPRAPAAPMAGMLGIDPTSSKIFSNGNIYDINDLPSMYKAMENGDLEGTKVPPPPGMLMTPAAAVKAHLDSIPDWKKEWGSSIRNYGAGFAAIGAAAGSDTALDKFKQLSGDADLLSRHSSAPDQFKDVEFGTNFLPYVRKLGIGSVPYIAEAMVTGLGLGSLFKGGGVAAAKTFAEGAIKKEATNLLANSALRMTEEQALVQAANTVGKSLARSGGMVAGTYPSSVGDILGNQYDQTSQNGGEGKFDLGSAAALGVPYAGLNLAGMEGLASGGRFLGSQAGKSTLKAGARGALGFGEVLAGEAFNESGQEVMNQAGRVAVDPNASMTSDDALNRYKESAIGGAILGAVGGAAHGAHMALAPTALTPTELLQRVSTNESRWDAGVQNNASTSQQNEWRGPTGISEDQQPPPPPPPPAPPAPPVAPTPPAPLQQVETTGMTPAQQQAYDAALYNVPEALNPNPPAPFAMAPAMANAAPGETYDFVAQQATPTPVVKPDADIPLTPHQAQYGTQFEPGSAEGLRQQLNQQQAAGDVEDIRKAEGELKKGKPVKAAVTRAQQKAFDNQPAAEATQDTVDTPQGVLPFSSPMEDWKARLEKIAAKHSAAGYLIRKALAHDDQQTAAKALREQAYKLRPARAADTSESAESTMLKKLKALNAAHTVLTGQNIRDFVSGGSEAQKFARLTEGLTEKQRLYFSAAIGENTGVRPDSQVQIAVNTGLRQDTVAKLAKSTEAALKKVAEGTALTKKEARDLFDKARRGELSSLSTDMRSKLDAALEEFQAQMVSPEEQASDATGTVTGATRYDEGGYDPKTRELAEANLWTNAVIGRSNTSGDSSIPSAHAKREYNKIVDARTAAGKESRAWDDLSRAEQLHISDSLKSVALQPDKMGEEGNTSFMEESADVATALSEQEEKDKAIEDLIDQINALEESKDEEGADKKAINAELRPLKKELKKLEAAAAVSAIEREKTVGDAVGKNPAGAVKAETKRVMDAMAESKTPTVETERQADTPIDVETQKKSEKPGGELAVDGVKTRDDIVAENLVGKQINPKIDIGTEIENSVDEWDALHVEGDPKWNELSTEEQAAWATNYIKWKSGTFGVLEPKDYKANLVRSHEDARGIAEVRTKPTAPSGAGETKQTEGPPATGIQEAFARAKKTVRDNTVPDAVKRLQKQIEEVKNALTRQSQKAAVASAVKTALADKITDQARVYRLQHILDKYSLMRDKEQAGRSTKTEADELAERDSAKKNVADLADKINAANEKIKDSLVQKNIRAQVGAALAEGENSGTVAKLGKVLAKAQKQLRDETVSPVAYSEGARGGAVASKIEAALKKLFFSPSRFDSLVTIVQSARDLSPADYAQLAQSDNPKTVGGMASKSQNRIILIADNITPGEELGVFLHELGVHIGLEKLIGKENMETLTWQIEAWSKQKGTKESKIAKEAVRRANASSSRSTSEEKIAYFIEEAVKAGIDPTAVNAMRGEGGGLGNWFRTLWAAAKAALRKIGLNRFEKLTAQNLVDLVYGAADLELNGGFHATMADFRRLKASVELSGTANGNEEGLGVYITDSEGSSKQWASDKNRKIMRVSTPVRDSHLLDYTAAQGDFDPFIRTALEKIKPTLKKAFADYVSHGEDLYSKLVNYYFNNEGKGPYTGTSEQYWNDHKEAMLKANALLSSVGIQGVIHRNAYYGGTTRVIFNDKNVQRVMTEVGDSKTDVKFSEERGSLLAHPTPADFVPTTTFKGKVVDVIGKLQHLGVSFRELSQIEREYKDLPVEPYTKLTHLTGAYAKKILDRGVNSVLNVWNTFDKAENKQFTDMLNKDTLAQFLSSEDVTHPRNQWIQNAVDLSKDKSAEDIEYAEKQAARFQAQRDAFNRMPKKMQELYREVDSFMQDMAKEEFKNRAGATVDAFLPHIKELATPEQRAAIEKLSFSNEPDMKEFSAYKKAMLAILKGTDPKKVENKKAVDAFREMANEVSDKMEGYHQRKGLYFPLLRFGDHLVIAKSKVFADLEKTVDDLKSEVNEFKKTNPVLQEYAELVATAAEAREAARGRLRSPSARTGFENATKAVKEFKKTVEFKQANRELLDIRDDLKNASADLKHKAAQQEHYAFHREESQDKANQRVENYRANGMDAVTKLRDEWIDGMDTVSTSFSKKLIDKLSAHYQNDPAMQARISGTVRKIFTDTQHDQSALHRMAMRRNVAGFHPDGNRVFQSFLQQSSHRLAAQKYFMQTQDALENVRRAASDNDKSPTAKEKLTAVANELAIRNDMDMQYRETPIQDSVARFTQLMTLGMSPAFLLQQSAQPMMLTLPQLRGRSSSADAVKALTTAMVDAWKILRASAKGSGLMNRFAVKLDHPMLTAGEKQALHEISDLGLIDILLDHDVALGAKGQQMGRYDKFVEMTNWAGRQIEVVNRIGSALAAYREEIKRGGTQAEATKYAANVVEQSQVDYSNENASRWTKRGAFSGSKIITQFKKYQIHMIQMLVWNAKEAVAGETPAARTEARRILVGMLTTHGIMGGTLGLPFAAPVFGIAKLVSLMWPSDDRDDPETAYKNFLADMLGKDLGDVVARGVFASLGLDLSRTLGLGTLFNPVPFVRTDKQGKDLLNEMVLGLLGPSVSVGQRMADGASKLANGDLLGAWTGMAPKFLASPARAFKTGTEGITTKEGNTRIPADQFTGGDLAAIALGLPDLKVSKYYEYNSAFEDSKAAAAQKVAMLKHAWVRGDAEEKAKVQKQIDEFNDRHETDQIKQKDLFAAQRQEAAYHKKVTPEGLMVSKKTREFAEGIRF